MIKDFEELKNSSEFAIQKSKPYQISIWEAFGEEEPPPPENITFSVSCIDDWPLVSDFGSSRASKDLSPRIARSKDLNIVAPPGYSINAKGTEAKGSFVGEHEWKLFIVLRKMALERGGYQLNGDFALSFSLRELSKFFFESTGRKVNPQKIRERLEVLRTAVYQVSDKDTSAHFSLLRELFIATREELKKDGNAKCYVMFDHMTEKTLTSGKGALIDYNLACKLPHVAAWLYSKLERAGIQSGLEANRPYKLWLKDTLYRVGLDNSKKTVNILKKEVTKAMVELIEHGVLRSFEFKDKLANSTGRGRKKLIDSEISLVITDEFESNIKKKLWSTQKLRAGKGNKIKTLALETPTKRPKLNPVKTEHGYTGYYQRNSENDPRKSSTKAPVDAEWREEDRRNN
jgi:hypothetical protein